MMTVDDTARQTNIAAPNGHGTAGGEIILAKDGVTVARITALPRRGPRQPGVARHWILDNDALLAPIDPDDLDWADGLHTDDLGVTCRPPA